MSARYLAAIDVGGTFTDIAVWDAAERQITLHKLLSTPDDHGRAMSEGLRAVGLPADRVIHATTLVTNALIERRGVTIGLITTEGFRDVVETATELRYDSFDLNLRRPTPLAPRRLRLTVDERIGADGAVVRELDVEAVQAAAQKLVDQGVESIAVGFFNSYRNSAHEDAAGELIAEVAPWIPVSTSHSVASEIREYPRFSTAMANAYVQPITDRYLTKLAGELSVPLQIMLSDGGIASAETAAKLPVQLVESGPAAGTMGAASLAAQLGLQKTLAFDMGGTTAKISLVRDAVPERTHELEVGRVHRFKKGSGLPVRIPVVELIEIGAGGGSIASPDSLGLLSVGPRSAGSVPGPACYGLGGEETTVTDADLYLGYLNPDRFLNGELKLDAEKNDLVLASLANGLGLDQTRAAAGVAEVVNNNMASAAQIHIAEHGEDPRDFTMVAFGGAGPVHAYGIADLLGIKRVVFPRGAGVASSIGMLVAPRSVEHTQTLVADTADLDWAVIDETLAQLERSSREVLAQADAMDDEIDVSISADMRFAGQGFEVTVPIPRSAIEEHSTEALVDAFQREYTRRFDRQMVSNTRAEVISWRVRVECAPVVSDFTLSGPGPVVGSAAKTTRPAYFNESGGFTDVDVYDRAHLEPGAVVRGPAVIEEAESTIVVGPSASAVADEDGNVVMTMGQDEAG